MSTRAVDVMRGDEWMQRIGDGDESVYEALFRTFAPGLSRDMALGSLRKARTVTVPLRLRYALTERGAAIGR